MTTTPPVVSPLASTPSAPTPAPPRGGRGGRAAARGLALLYRVGAVGGLLTAVAAASGELAGVLPARVAVPLLALSTALAAAGRALGHVERAVGVIAAPVPGGSPALPSLDVPPTDWTSAP